MVKISVIVPLYNMADYLESTIRCIINQSFSEIEIILIDDGSTDETSKFINRFAIDEERIKIVSQKNAGVSVARNVGLKLASGEFVAFIDGDDIVDERYLDVLLSGIDSTTAVSMCGHARIFTRELNETERNEDFILIKAEECAIRLLKGFFSISVWGVLFRKELLGNLRFQADVISNEDKLFLYAFLSGANDWNVSFTNSKLYGYYVRQNSASKKEWSGSTDVITVADQMYDMTKERHPEWLQFAKNNQVTRRFDVLKDLVRVDSNLKQYQETYKQIKREINEIGISDSTDVRTRVQYHILRIGDMPYRSFVKMFYKLNNEEKSFRENEKRTRQ